MIYLASSWRNEYQQDVVSLLRAWGHEVYDFRNPGPGDHGFHWSEIDELWREWSVQKYRCGLQHEVAKSGFTKDMNALTAAATVVLLLPCGKSAHAEAGWAAGAGKPVYVFMLPGAPVDPELMYLMFNGVTDDAKELQAWVAEAESVSAPEEATGG